MTELRDSFKLFILWLLLLIAASSLKAQNTTGTVTDIDGNTYRTIKIGKQVWMAENLRVTHYSDGTTIPYITKKKAWASLKDNNSDKAYCFYKNKSNSGYGVLYTYAAATNGNSSKIKEQGIAPDGWHLPSDSDWQQLEDYLIANGYNYDGSTNGDKTAKSLASKKGWNRTSDLGGPGHKSDTNNHSGFTALAGGYRHSEHGSFLAEKNGSNCWISSDKDSKNGCARTIYTSGKYLRIRYTPKSMGYSVRCIKD